MFDFEDSKLGRVKVVNVTEARANISTIMSDSESNYVITKNNKPVRVVINYSAFKKIQSAPSPQQKHEESRQQIKGLLESREKDLQEQKKIEVEPALAIGQNLSPMARNPEISRPAPAPAERPKTIAKDKVPQPRTEEEMDYYEKYRKLYESSEQKKSMEPPQFTSPVVTEEGTDDPLFDPDFETELPEPVSDKRYSSTLSDPPSIQDLLSELEDEKLTGED